jgi:hypothetical protein
MIRRFKRVLILCIIGAPFLASAQDESDLVEFLNAGPTDASKLMNAYLNPVIEGLSYGFNGGWYTTAKAHKPLGFDIGVSLNAVFIPSSKNYFKPADLNLNAAILTSPASGQAPTLVGPEEPTTYGIDINGDNQPDDIDGNGQPDTFNGPEGLDYKENIKISGVLAPTAQVGIGVYKNTDLKIRWMPEVETGSTKVKLFGIGVLHDIKQHIAGIKVLPFDLSVLVAFTKIQGTSGMAGTFDAPSSDPRPQEMDYDMEAWLFQALISKKLAIFTFHGGIGFNTINTNANLTGSYIVVPGTPQGTLKDPVSLGFKNNSMRLSGGIRMNLGPVYLNGEYTLQEYSTVSIGLGVTVR